MMTMQAVSNRAVAVTVVDGVSYVTLAVSDYEALVQRANLAEAIAVEAITQAEVVLDAADCLRADAEAHVMDRNAAPVGVSGTEADAPEGERIAPVEDASAVVAEASSSLQNEAQFEPSTTTPKARRNGFQKSRLN